MRHHPFISCHCVHKKNKTTASVSCRPTVLSVELCSEAQLGYVLGINTPGPARLLRQ